MDGGLAVCKRDFWQKAPASIDIMGMDTTAATVKVWIYSPHGQPMDMRRYDSRSPVDACYEGFHEMRATANGVANTNEMVVEPFNAFPGNEALVERAISWQSPNLLLCAPQYILGTLALGDAWSPVNRSTPQLARIEDYLDALLEQHKLIREQFDQYGF